MPRKLQVEQIQNCEFFISHTKTLYKKKDKNARKIKRMYSYKKTGFQSSTDFKTSGSPPTRYRAL